MISRISYVSKLNSEINPGYRKSILYTEKSKINSVMEFYDVIGNESDDSGTNSSWNSDTDCEIDENGENLSEEDKLYSENENEDEEIDQFHEIDNEDKIG
ncbi:hypothetical protein L1887_38264 [Cichorium endivia]|nr:hypothetical protein L1887_38264 [Cichorium endivia]